MFKLVQQLEKHFLREREGGLDLKCSSGVLLLDYFYEYFQGYLPERNMLQMLMLNIGKSVWRLFDQLQYKSDL